MQPAGERIRISMFAAGTAVQEQEVARNDHYAAKKQDTRNIQAHVLLEPEQKQAVKSAAMAGNRYRRSCT